MKAILLDIWGTILFREGISFEEKIAEYIGIDYDEFRPWLKSNKGISSSYDLTKAIQCDLEKKLSLEEILGIEKECFESIYFKNNIFSVLKQLKLKGEVGTISNCSYFTSGVLTRFSIKTNYNFLSYKLGVLKPNESFFLNALKVFRQRPKDVIMVGNDAQKDIIPANKLGMTTFHLNEDKSSDSPANYVISNIDELLTYDLIKA